MFRLHASLLAILSHHFPHTYILITRPYISPICNGLVLWPTCDSLTANVFYEQITVTFMATTVIPK